MSDSPQVNLNVRFSQLTLKRTSVERAKIVQAFERHGIGDLVAECPNPLTALGNAINSNAGTLGKIMGVDVARFSLPEAEGEGYEVYAGRRKTGDSTNLVMRVHIDTKSEYVHFDSGLPGASVESAIAAEYQRQRIFLDRGRQGVSIERALRKKKIYRWNADSGLTFVGLNEEIAPFAADSRELGKSGITLGESLALCTGGLVTIRRHSMEGSPDDVATLVDSVREEFGARIKEIEDELGKPEAVKRKSTWERRETELKAVRTEMESFEQKLGVSMQDLRDEALKAERGCAAAGLALSYEGSPFGEA